MRLLTRQDPGGEEMVIIGSIIIIMWRRKCTKSRLNQIYTPHHPSEWRWWSCRWSLAVSTRVFISRLFLSLALIQNHISTQWIKNPVQRDTRVNFNLCPRWSLLFGMLEFESRAQVDKWPESILLDRVSPPPGISDCLLDGQLERCFGKRCSTRASTKHFVPFPIPPFNTWRVKIWMWTKVKKYGHWPGRLIDCTGYPISREIWWLCWTERRSDA